MKRTRLVYRLLHARKHTRYISSCLACFRFQCVIDNAEKEDLESIIMELEVMKSLRNHPHVVGLIGHCIEKGALFMFSYHISFCCSFLFLVC